MDIGSVTGYVPDVEPNLGRLAVVQPKKSRKSEPQGQCQGMEEKVSVDGKTFTLTWCRDVYNAEFKPDGRKCSLCNLHDCDPDPVSKSAGIEEQCWWGTKPRISDGFTQSDCCGYCYRVYTSRIKLSGLSLTDYKHELGKSESKLNAHQALVTASIEEYIAKGGQRRCHIDWVTAEKTALALVRTMQMNIRKPGWEHQEWNFYMANHDNRIETESGHREFTWQGTRGVLIPDKPITKIEFNEQIAAVMSQDLGSTASLGLVTENDIQHNMHNLASNLFYKCCRAGWYAGCIVPTRSFVLVLGWSS